MKLLPIGGAITLLIGTATAAPLKLELPANIKGEINLTTDSRPGWMPSAEQRQRALKAVEVLLDALEGGRYAEAYALLSDVNKRSQTLAQFIQEQQKFRSVAGPAKFWRVLKVTWTKDPVRAPLPGAYAAVDLAAQFANVDRDCGYIVVYQKPDGGDFTVMRRENNYIDNATALAIEEKHSRADLLKVWGQLSRHCPNYVPAVDAH